MTLPVLQRFLTEAFQRPNPVVDDEALSRACAEHVTGNDRLSPAEQVDIYRRQFWLRHVDSLREDYPGLVYVLGDDLFEAFCRAYLGAHPPCTPSLRDLGADIVPFAERWDGFGARRALAVDMVRYENAFVDLFDGPDVVPLDPSVVTAMPPEAWSEASLELHPLLVFLRLDHPVHHIRYAVREGRRPELPDAPSRHCVVLFRMDLVIHYRDVSETAMALLEKLRDGVPLAPALDAVVAERGEEAAAELGASVGGWFRDWAAWGWLVGIRRP